VARWIGSDPPAENRYRNRKRGRIPSKRQKCSFYHAICLPLLDGSMYSSILPRNRYNVGILQLSPPNHITCYRRCRYEFEIAISFDQHGRCATLWRQSTLKCRTYIHITASTLHDRSVYGAGNTRFDMYSFGLPCIELLRCLAIVRASGTEIRTKR
jgi:hypothetical protein